MAAQGALSSEAQEALIAAQRAAAEALLEYDTHFPDRPLWREAIRQGERAARLAPDRPEPQRLLAEALSVTGWYNRAWRAWERYFELGGMSTPKVDRLRFEAAEWLGVNLYNRGDVAAAIPYLEAMTELADRPPDRRRLAEAYLATDRPEAAAELLEPLASGDPAAAARLEFARDWLRHGEAAATAFAEGRSLLASGRTDAALEPLTRAAEAPDFAEAQRLAGRAALAAGRPGAAVDYWRRLLELRPGDAEANAQLEFASAQARYGVAPYRDYLTALDAVAAGDLAAARTALERAVAISPAFPEAQLELGRVLLEQEDAESAAERLREARAQGAPPSQVAPLLERAETAIAEAEAQAQAEAEAEAEARAEAQAQAQAEAQARAEAQAQAQAEARTQAETEAARTAEPEPSPPASPTATTPETSAEVAPEPAPTPAPEPVAAVGDTLTLLDATVQHQSSEQGGSGAFTFVAGRDENREALATIDPTAATLHVRADVTGKPDDRPVRAQLCLVPRDISVRPVCTDGARLTMDATGSYTLRQQLTTLGGFDALASSWSRGFQSYLIVLTDDEGNPLDERYTSGGDASFEDDAYYPMTINYQAVVAPDSAPFTW